MFWQYFQMIAMTLVTDKDQNYTHCVINGTVKINMFQLFASAMSYKLDLRKSVAKLFGKHNTGQILNLFKDEPISRRIKEQSNKEKSGRPTKLNKATTTKLVSSAINKVGVSQRRLARKYSVSQATVHRVLKKKNVFKRQRKRAPKYTAKQLEKIPKCCRNLRMKHFKKGISIILDDEKYITIANHTLSGNDHFYMKDINKTPDHVKFASKEKFEPKILVWMAISEKGLSAPYIRPIGGRAVDSDVYIDNCLTKLKDFIDLHHSKDNYIFWPDLARCHYSKKTLAWLSGQNIHVVPQEDNPPNVLQARPIEKFWAILTRLVYDAGWEAKTERQLVGRIQRKLKEVDLKVVQTMMATIRPTLRKIEENGPLTAL